MVVQISRNWCSGGPCVLDIFCLVWSMLSEQMINLKTVFVLRGSAKLLDMGMFGRYAQLGCGMKGSERKGGDEVHAVWSQSHFSLTA